MRSPNPLHYLFAPLSFFLIAQIALCQQIHGPTFRFDNQDNGNLDEEDLPEDPNQRRYDPPLGFPRGSDAGQTGVSPATSNRGTPTSFGPSSYTIANIPTNTVVPPSPSDINQFISGFRQDLVNPRFDLLSIAINDNSAIGEYTPLCATLSGLQAYFDQKYNTLGDAGFLSVCDQAFTYPVSRRH
ncbi:uncharacterized protein Z520_11881 [Fonsecaea multimorphosa CBS 102226]|uniref:Uncharacterized protein n=1 Tax=Fonsecaea multimorphosa CBS 102226 TaxID=1442371 RepID=A0A0D2I5A3_9EURO|nr:uncharacterized protein Z520_11881 [Fonsecaea multimorphosa CBS 102226]KIX92406.1 hypothetical protein Z520_11881 [Fonsecaea multimorphosa CBS 102226]